MKQKLLNLKSWLLMMCLLVGVSNAWADSFSTTYSYGLNGWSLTNYTDQSSYYQVPSGNDPSVATISGIFSDKTITSNVVVTINCGTYGSGTNPSASTFSLYKETACTNAITATQGGTLPTDKSYKNVTYTITQANAASLNGDLAIKITKPGKTIRLNSIKVEFSYTTSGGGTTPEPTKYNVTVANNIEGGTVTANSTSAAEKAEVTLTATPNDGYEFGSWNVTNASTSGTITVTNNKFTMPAANVNVSATFNQIQGGDIPVSPENEILYESFDTNDGTGGNDDLWSGQIASSNIKYDDNNWSADNGSGANKCIKLGTGSKLGSATTPAIGLACDATMTFKAAAWDYKDENTTLKLSVIGDGTISPTTVTLEKGKWTEYTVTLTGLTASSKIKFEGEKASNSRFFLDEVSVVKAGEATPEKTLISIDATGTPADFWVGDDFNHNGITVTATYDDDSKEDVTSVAEYSGYDMSKAGNQSVTVTYGGQTATYNITVKTIANTQETAYTTAQAKALIDAGKDLDTEVYVTGVVSKVDKFNEAYKSITYWLDDNSFEVYGGLAAEGEEFSSVDDIKVGATVVVLGKITIYKGTYEVNSNSHLVSYEAPQVTKYNVTILTDEIENGTVTADKETAAEGETVTLTITPDEGYSLAQLVVYTADTYEEIDVEDNSFIMPAADVEVYAFFMPAATDEFNTLSEFANANVPQGSFVSISFDNEIVEIAINEETQAIVLKDGDNTFMLMANAPCNTEWKVGGTLAGSNWNAMYLGKNLNTGAYMLGNMTDDPWSGITYKAPAESTYTPQTLTFKAINDDGYWATFSSNEVTFWPNYYIVSAVGVENNELYTFGNEEAFDEDIVDIDEENTIDGYYVPANTGVLVYSVDETATYYTVNGITPSNDVEAVNMLRPSTVQMEENGYKFYKLSYLDSKDHSTLGFYWGAENGAPFKSTLTNGAYLAVPESVGAPRGFRLTNDESTGIENINITTTKSNVMYNLAGQRVNANAKGIIIVNGKKLLNK